MLSDLAFVGALTGIVFFFVLRSILRENGWRGFKTVIPNHIVARLPLSTSRRKMFLMFFRRYPLLPLLLGIQLISALLFFTSLLAVTLSGHLGSRLPDIFQGVIVMLLGLLFFVQGLAGHVAEIKDGNRMAKRLWDVIGVLALVTLIFGLILLIKTIVG